MPPAAAEPPHSKGLWILFVLLATASTAHAQQFEEITVTATRTETRVADTPASVVVLSREVLESTAGLTADDALRQIPGFTLFRRTGSRVANPTTQGVTLRGIGASGASRALVLDDGIPINDPFGGWVHWGRIARVATERVEVVRGGASELYGSAAMGGVVQFIRRRDDTLTAEFSAGTESTYAGSLFAAIGPARVIIDGLATGGYILVAPAQRGPVDRGADSQHLALDLSLLQERFFIRASHYDESRNNGTALQTNDTRISHLAAGGELGGFTARGWIGDQNYEQTFSAIAANRASERLTAEQRTPSRSDGATLQWSRLFGERHALLAGVEGRGVTSEGTDGQRIFSAFVEDIVAVTPALSITAGARLDTWRDEREISPRVAVLWRPRGPLAYTVSAYRAFRAPTLNELHRGFRVGNVMTLANESLTAERLDAIEAGLRLRNVRATLFLMRMSDVIANVTVSTTPSLITRQRRNVASSRSRGVEVEGEWRLGRRMRGSAGYLLSDAVTGGKRTPQVARHQATAQLIYAGPLTAAMQARWSTSQFDDDLNAFRLAGYTATDALLSREIGRGLTVTLAIENLFDEQIEAGATPVTTLGQPRAFRAGLRFRP